MGDVRKEEAEGPRPEFKVNEFITLKLEGHYKGFLEEFWETIIYVKGERFDQCKFLLLEIPVDEVKTLDQIESIDEAAEKLDRSLEPIHGHIMKIPPDVEFWGHCSNLQVWFENDYNTRLLHSNLAFPLLKKLTEAGDPLAGKVFKEEIAKRLEKSSPTVLEYLINEKYFNFLNQEEIESMLEKPESKLLGNLVTLGYIILNGVLFKRDKFRLRVNAGNGKAKNIEEIKGLKFHTDLKELDLWNNQISEITGLETLTNLEDLIIRENQISEIKGLENLKSLKVLDLDKNQISEIKGLEDLKSLKVLDLDKNQVSEIKGLENLPNLVILSLRDNQISEIKGLKTLKKLTHLNLGRTKLTDKSITDAIKELKALKALESLSLRDNDISAEVLEMLREELTARVLF